MSTVFVDSHVLLHSEDGADRARQARAVEWLQVLWKRRCGRLSTQVLGEFYTSATRRLKPGMPAGDARAEVRRYQSWRPWVIDHATVETAWAIESRFGFDLQDSLVIAAAKAQACDFLLSDRLPHDQVIDGVRIVNPFLIGPEVLDHQRAAAPDYAPS